LLALRAWISKTSEMDNDDGGGGGAKSKSEQTGICFGPRVGLVLVLVYANDGLTD